jgi:hypothetical protein
MKNLGQLLFVFSCLLCGCAASTADSGTDSSTQFWDTCTSDNECGELNCLCGRCTAPCDSAALCSELTQTATCDSAARFCADEGALCVAQTWSGNADADDTESSAPGGTTKDPEAGSATPLDADGAAGQSAVGSDADSSDLSANETSTSDGDSNETSTSDGDSSETSTTSDDGGTSTEPPAPDPTSTDAGRPSAFPPLPIDTGTTLFDGRVYQLSAAATTREGALLLSAYMEGDENTHILLQALTLGGEPDGDAIELGVEPGVEDMPVSLATDGERYVACWQSASNVQCAAIDLGAATIDLVLDVNGSGGVVAYGFDKWVVAYGVEQGASTAVVLQPLSATFELQPSKTFGELQTGTPPVLERTSDGFILFDNDVANAYNYRSTRFDASLTPVGEPISWATSYWLKQPGVFTAGPQVVLAGPKPYAAQVMSASTTQDMVSVDVPGGGKNGMSVAFIDASGEPVACWQNIDRELERVPVSILADVVEPGLGDAYPTLIVITRLGERDVAIVTTTSPGATSLVKLVPLN